MSAEKDKDIVHTATSTSVDLVALMFFSIMIQTVTIVRLVHVQLLCLG